MGKTTKTFAMPGDGITEEGLQRAKEFSEARQEEKKEILAKQEENKSEVDFMNADFDPFEDRVLIYADPVEEKTKGGLYKPDSAVEKEKPLRGTVVNFGEGKMNAMGVFVPVKLERGWHVWYGNYAGTPMEINGIKYLIMRFADIFGRAK